MDNDGYLDIVVAGGSYTYIYFGSADTKASGDYSAAAWFRVGELAPHGCCGEGCVVCGGANLFGRARRECTGRVWRTLKLRCIIGGRGGKLAREIS